MRAVNFLPAVCFALCLRGKGADLGLSTSSFGGGGSSIGALEEAGGNTQGVLCN